MTIADIASISSGYHFRGKVEGTPVGDVPVIQAKDVREDLRIDLQTLHRVHLDGGRRERYAVRAGDVIFLSRGHRPTATVVGDVPANTIVPSYFYIVRVDQRRVRPDYVAWYLNHPQTQAELKQMYGGSAMPFIAMSAFSELKLPVPPLETQQKIVALAQLSKEEEKLQRQLTERRAALIAAVCMGLANGEEEGEI